MNGRDGFGKFVRIWNDYFRDRLVTSDTPTSLNSEYFRR